MTRPGHVLAAALALLSAAPAVADDDACELCMLPLRPGGERPLQIDIESGLKFSRLALLGRDNGAVEIDAQTGEKRVDAGMIDLGGVSYQGHAIVTGEPLRPVRRVEPRHRRAILLVVIDVSRCIDQAPGPLL